MAVSEGGKETERRMRDDPQEWRHDYAFGLLGEEEAEINEIIGGIRFSARRQNLS